MDVLFGRGPFPKIFRLSILPNGSVKDLLRMKRWWLGIFISGEALMIGRMEVTDG